MSETKEIIPKEKEMELITKNYLAKIRFLQQENAFLESTLADVEECLEVNRSIMMAMLEEEETKEKVSHTLNSVSNTTRRTNTAQMSQETQKLRKFRNVFKALHEENMKLAQINKRLSQERNQALSKSLINEQIAEAAMQSEQEIISSMQESLHKLHKDVYNRDVAYATLEKELREMIDSAETKRKRGGLAVESVGKLTSESLNMHVEIGILKKSIESLEHQLVYLKEEKEDLLRINTELTFKIYHMNQEVKEAKENDEKGTGTNIEKSCDEKNHDLLKVHKNFVVSLLNSSSKNSIGSSSSSASDSEESPKRKKGGLLCPSRLGKSFETFSFDTKLNFNPVAKTSDVKGPPPVPKLNLRKAKEFTMIQIKRAEANPDKKEKKKAAVQEEDQEASKLKEKLKQ